MNKKLNLKNDIIFKTFFSKKGNEKYLIEFLNAILKTEIKSIKIREEVNLEKLAIGEKGRKIRLASRTKQRKNSKHRNANKKRKKHRKKNNDICSQNNIKRNKKRNKI